VSPRRPIADPEKSYENSQVSCYLDWFGSIQRPN